MRLKRSGDGLNASLQAVLGDRLLNVIIHPERLSFANHIRIFSPGDHNKSSALGARAGPHIFQQDQAVHIRHVVIGNDQMKGRLFHIVQGVYAICGPAIIFYSDLLDRIDDKAATGGSVVDNQNSKFFFQ